MPIEDVDFLGGNSELDSTLFFVDSGMRDRSVFPSPAEYVVQFSEPIKLVVGVDVLDATVPSAMYAVDTHNDTLSLATLSSTQDPPTGKPLYEHLQDIIVACPVFASHFASTAATSLYCVAIGELQPSDMNAFLSWVGPATSAYLIAIPATGAVKHFPSEAAIDTFVSSLSSGAVRTLVVRKRVIVVENGNYNLIDLMTQLGTSIRDASADVTFQSFDVVSSSSTGVNRRCKYAFVNHAAAFVMDMAASSIASVIGFDTIPASFGGSGRDGYVGVRTGHPATFGSVPSTSVAQSTLSAKLLTSDHVVVAPGVVNLLGVRYITLRCPEVEQHMYSGMTYGSFSTGIGVFKLPSVNEISNLRFDFVSLVRKPFHPIGRLSRLTLRFERNDGSLYDFKGVNNQILLAVKFLSPGRRVHLQRSVINPDYDPDYLRYTLRMGVGHDSGDDGRPSCPPQLCGDDASVDGEGDGDGISMGAGTGTGRGAGDDDGVEGHVVFLRRQEIARRLLAEQDKYDYPPYERDPVWRSSGF